MDDTKREWVRSWLIKAHSDLAHIYGVPTSRFNEAVKRNATRFPDDFRFQLTKAEWEKVQPSRSPVAALNPEAGLKSRIVISGSGHGGRRKLPWAFTEHGAIMAANVLNSPRAVQMSVFMVRALLKPRELLAARRSWRVSCRPWRRNSALVRIATKPPLWTCSSALCASSSHRTSRSPNPSRHAGKSASTSDPAKKPPAQPKQGDDDAPAAMTAPALAPLLTEADLASPL